MSFSPNRKRVGLFLGALAATSFTYVAVATAPTAGTLSPTTTPLNATGGPYAISNPSGTAELQCGPQICDDYNLTLAVPPAYRTANPNAVVKITLDWSNDSGADDLDLYLQNRTTNAQVAASASSDPQEVITKPLSEITTNDLRVRIVPFATTGSTATLKIELLATNGGGGGGTPTDPCLASGTASNSAARIDAGVIRDWASLPISAEYGAFIRFDLGSRETQDAVLERVGLSLKQDFRKHVNSMFVSGPISAFRALALERGVARIEHNTPIRYLDATATWATRAKVMHEPVLDGPYMDAAGNPITGKGVTLGVIDSGMFGPHPDFAGRVLHNWKLINPVGGGAPNYVDVGTTSDSENPAGGHGTHVSGTVFGSGAASNGNYPMTTVAPFIKGTFPGVAPEARMVHWAHGAGLFVLSAVTAYEHILNQPSAELPRAINNSYGSDGSPDGDNNDETTSGCLIKRIVNEKQITMLFAASNDGGDGSINLTSPTCQSRIPGVICVASYNDKGTGDRDSQLSTFSSRGKKGLTTTYPDVAAPGDLITSTCAQATGTQAICTGGDDQAAETEWQPLYGTISGTSMATPHTTGVIGLILQVNPNLKPAAQELLLQRTALKVGPYPDGTYEADPQQEAGGNTGGTAHYAFGAGLVDLRRIMADPLMTGAGVTATGFPGDGYVFTVFDGDTGSSDTPAPNTAAADLRKLTLQNVTLSGQTGLMARLTVANSTSFGTSTSVGYTMELNANGKPFKTTVVARPNAVAGQQPTVTAAEPSPSNTALASNASAAANVISFFIPYSQLGFIPRHELIHNIRVFSSDQTGFIDIAPSATNQPVAADTEGATLKPMYGRSFTSTLVPALPPPSNEKECILPGVTRIVSPTGVTGNGGASLAEDLRQVWISEPKDAGLRNPDKLVVTVKVGGLSQSDRASSTVNRWYFYFKAPNRSSAEQFVALDATAPASQAAPRFITGTRSIAASTPAASPGAFTIEKTALPGSSFDAAAGTITFVLDKTEFGFKTGDELSALGASLRQTTNPQNGVGLTVDSAAATGNYKLVGNSFCDVNNAPVPKIVATPTSGKKPLEVSFLPTGTTDADGDAIKSYTYNFGDGSAAKFVITADAVKHTYTQAGKYTATLNVVDARDKSSDTVASVVIDVIGDAAEAFSFIERTDVKPNTFITSEAVAVKGFTGTLPVSVSAGLQYSIDGGPFTSSPGSIMPGQKLAVRHVSSATEGERKTSKVTVGDATVDFVTVTTVLDHVPAAFDFGKTENVTGNTLVESPMLTLNAYDDAPVVPASGQSYRINGGEWKTAAGKIVCGGADKDHCTAKLQVRHKSNASSLGYTKSTITVGGVKGSFMTRTKK